MRGTVDFGDGPHTAADGDLFVLVLDAAGNTLWSARFGVPRTHHMTTNLGVVRFDAPDDDVTAVVHQLYSYDPRGARADHAESYTTYRISLDPDDEAPPVIEVGPL